MKSKKIVLMIVEGKSDEKAYSLCINEYLKSINKYVDVACEIYHTDIRLHTFSSQEVIASTSLDEKDYIERIKIAVFNYLSENKGEGLIIEDIIAVAILSDLDACYCEDKRIVYSESGFNEKKEKYDLNCNEFYAKNVLEQIKINDQKRNAHDIINSIKLIKFDTDNGLKYTVLFRAFYQSINLEHITINNPNLTSNSNKEDRASEFRDQYLNRPLEFYDFINDLSKIGSNYDSSWNKTMLKKFSFEQMTNLKYFIEWITEIADNNSK